MATPDFSGVAWRKSSFSSDNGMCVETASLGGRQVAVRNSNYPKAGVLLLSSSEVTAWIRGVKAGEYDDFA